MNAPLSSIYFLILICCCTADSTQNAWIAEEDYFYDENADYEHDELIIDQHIVGGSSVSRGKFPAFVQYGLPGTLCGGALIHPDIVLSAAHCGRPSNNKVYIMANSTLRNSGIERTVVSVIEHHSYSTQGLLVNDFIILKLDSPVTGVAPVRVNTDRGNPRWLDTVTAVGFGRTCSTCGTSPELLSVNLKASSSLTCRNDWSGYDSFVHLCAEGWRKDACRGDSGGPLFDSAGTLVGLTSFGDSSCGGGKSTVFARVSGASSWINNRVCTLSAVPPDGCRSASGVCFSPIASVMVKGKGKVAMSDLQVGDYVMTASGQYSSVLTNLHFHRSRLTYYTQIHTTSEEKALELTANHMLFLEGISHPVPASRVQVGDCLQTINGPQKVTNCTFVERNGLYNPMTSDGTIVVDGVIASTHATINGNEFIQIAGIRIMSHQIFLTLAYAPYRALCSAGFCNINEGSDPLYNQVGRAVFVMFERQHRVTQLVVISLFVLFFGFMYILPNILYLSILVVPAFMYLISKKQRKRKLSSSKKI